MSFGMQDEVCTGFIAENIDYREVVYECQKQCRKYLDASRYAVELGGLLEQQDEVDAVSIGGDCVSVVFTDGYHLVVFALNDGMQDSSVLLDEGTIKFTESSALVLNPFADIYGRRQCRVISRVLAYHSFDSWYLENDAVDLAFIISNLSAPVVYMNTHAGYWDVNASGFSELVVIATGEVWTADTPMKYAFEFENHMIVEGVIGDQSVVAFTPLLIDLYYDNTSFCDSLVVMATCDALHDGSMGEMFLSKGARVYVGWTDDTVFWTNNFMSIWLFRLLHFGWSVGQICDLISHGGFYNWLFGSTLSFVGDGSYQLP